MRVVTTRQAVRSLCYKAFGKFHLILRSGSPTNGVKLLKKNMYRAITVVRSNGAENEADVRSILITAYLLQVSQGNSFPYKEQSNKG